jgi:hypothetical protein
LVEARFGSETAPRAEAESSLGIAGVRTRAISCDRYFDNGDLGIVTLKSDAPESISSANLPTHADYARLDAQPRLRIVGYAPHAGLVGRRLGGNAIIASHDCSGMVKVTTQGKSVQRSAAEHYRCLEDRELVIDRTLTPGRRASGTCAGDSGGPGFLMGMSFEDGSTVLTVTSRSVPGQRGCSDASIMVRLTDDDLQWIHENAAEKL